MSIESATLQCSAGPQFGPHGGRQFRERRYFFCGCDAGYCEDHANIPLGRKMEPGEPLKCRIHRSRKPAEGK